MTKAGNLSILGLGIYKYYRKSLEQKRRRSRREGVRRSLHIPTQGVKYGLAIPSSA
jgi:hypothetical protein